MRALRLEGGLTLAEVAPPEPGPSEALIRVARAGICSTDLGIIGGYAGFTGTLGHEFVGVVETCDDPSWVSARVAGEITLWCGRCDNCDAGMRKHCRSRAVLGIVNKDGCFADYITLPTQNLHRIPDAVSDDAAAFVEPLAAGFDVTERIDVDAGWTIAVVGDGKLGLLTAMALRHTGADVTVVGKHERKLQIAESVGARIGSASDVPGKAFDLVVEASGSATGMDVALGLVRHRGTIVLKSTSHGLQPVNTAQVVVDEIAVVGSRCGPFDRAIAAVASGAIDPLPLLDATYPLADALAAIEHAQRPGTLKVALSPE